MKGDILRAYVPASVLERKDDRGLFELLLRCFFKVAVYFLSGHAGQRDSIGLDTHGNAVLIVHGDRNAADNDHNKSEKDRKSSDKFC